MGRKVRLGMEPDIAIAILVNNGGVESVSSFARRVDRV
jgi:hypothetical protein